MAGQRGNRNAAAQVSSGRGTETIPPQSQVAGGPETPLELGETGWRHVLKRTDHRDEMTLFLADVEHHRAPLAMQQKLHAGEPALQLADTRNRSDRVQPIGGYPLDILPLCHGEHELVG